MDPELDPGEIKIAIIHRHIAYLIPLFLGFAALGLLLLGVVFWLGRNAPTNLPAGLVGLVLAIITILAAAILLAALIIYRDNRLILTNQHLVVVVRNGLFSRQVSHLSLDRVQDVRATRTGFFATLLGYGDVEIETAGEENNFLFHYAPNPQKTADLIIETHEKFSHPAPPSP